MRSNDGDEIDEVMAKTTADLLAERAERDARRWEAAAVEMEKQRNAALHAKQEMEAEVAAMRESVREQALLMIEALDDLVARIARTFEVTAPSRGCPEENW